jgi:hypothetical protein
MVEERMLCPVCQLELGVERRADELVLTYSFGDLKTRCLFRDRGNPVLCGNLQPTILQELPESRVTPLRAQARARED